MIRTFGDVARMVSGTAAPGFENVTVRGVSKDTRTIQPGNLYVPLIGERFDGHDFVPDAFGKGASAALWQRDHGQPPEGVPLIFVDDALAALQRLAARYRRELPVRIVGVTGSNGKTTTKDMIASVLGTAYNVHKTEGNLNGDIGLPLTILQLTDKTQLAVLEMGMRGRGEIELLAKIAEPEIAVITNIGEAHIERLGSREEIARAKLEILRGLQEDGLFVHLGDEPLIERLLPEAEKPALMRRVRFGSEPGNDLYPASVETDADGVRFTVNGSDCAFSLPLPGRHNVVNALAAIAVGRALGITDADIACGLRTMKASGMRIERVKGINGLTILNDAYNASPTSMRAAIELLGELKGFRRKFAVLGDMLELGELAVQYHRDIGQMLSPDRLDYVYAYGPLAKRIAEAAVPVFPRGRVKWFEHKEDIVEEIGAVAAPDDIVLVKGSRGMKLEEVVDRLRERPL